MKTTSSSQVSNSIDTSKKEDVRTENIEIETETESTKKPSSNLVANLISTVQEKPILQHTSSIIIQPKTNTISTFKPPLKNYSKKSNQKEEKVNSSHPSILNSSNSGGYLSNNNNSNKEFQIENSEKRASSPPKLSKSNMQKPQNDQTGVHSRIKRIKQNSEISIHHPEQISESKFEEINEISDDAKGYMTVRESDRNSIEIPSANIVQKAPKIHLSYASSKKPGVNEIPEIKKTTGNHSKNPSRTKLRQSKGNTEESENNEFIGKVVQQKSGIIRPKSNAKQKSVDITQNKKKGITDSTQLPSLIESDEEDEKDKTSNYLMFQSSLQNKLKGGTESRNASQISKLALNRTKDYNTVSECIKPEADITLNQTTVNISKQESKFAKQTFGLK